MPYHIELVRLITEFEDYCNYKSFSEEKSLIDRKKNDLRNNVICIFHQLVSIIYTGTFIKGFNYLELTDKINAAFFNEEKLISEDSSTCNFDEEIEQEYPDFDEEKYAASFEYDYLLESSKDAILNWLKKLLLLHKTSSKTLVNNDAIWIANESLFPIEEEINIKDEYIANYCKTFNYIVKLFHIDSNLNSDFYQLKDLGKLKIFLEKNQISFITLDHKDPNIRKALICKTDFLIIKLIRAIDRNSDNLRYSIEEYTFDLYEPSYENASGSKHYNRFNTLKTNESIHNAYSLIKSKKIEEYTYDDFYTKAKHLKKKNIDSIPYCIQELSNLLIKFKETYNGVSNPFDKCAYEKTYICLYNNILSLKLTNPNIKDNDVLEYLIETREIQEEFNVKNYYPYLKICEYYKHKLSLLFKEPIHDFKINSTRATSLISSLEKTRMHLEVCIRWSETYLFWPFQPNFESCIDEIKLSHNEDIQLFKIFNASAYATPIDYTKIKDTAAQLKDEIHHYKIQFNIYDSTYGLEQNLKKNIVDLEKKTKDLEGISKKNVEILSVFSAIILFTIGDIQIFKEARSFKDALLFMMTFAYIISIFVILIRLIVKDSSKTISHFELLIIAILVLATITTTCFLIY